MQTAQKLTWGFSFNQTERTNLVVGQWHLTKLMQQALLTFGQKEDLILSSPVAHGWICAR